MRLLQQCWLLNPSLRCRRQAFRHCLSCALPRMDDILYRWRGWRGQGSYRTPGVSQRRGRTTDVSPADAWANSGSQVLDASILAALPPPVLGCVFLRYLHLLSPPGKLRSCSRQTRGGLGSPLTAFAADAVLLRRVGFYDFPSAEHCVLPPATRAFTTARAGGRLDGFLCRRLYHLHTLDSPFVAGLAPCQLRAILLLILFIRRFMPPVLSPPGCEEHALGVFCTRFVCVRCARCGAILLSFLLPRVHVAAFWDAFVILLRLCLNYLWHGGAIAELAGGSGPLRTLLSAILAAAVSYLRVWLLLRFGLRVHACAHASWLVCCCARSGRLHYCLFTIPWGDSAAVTLPLAARLLCRSLVSA